MTGPFKMFYSSYLNLTNKDDGDDSFKYRAKRIIRKITNSKFWIILTVMVNFLALFADDLRIIFFDKEYDNVFFSLVVFYMLFFLFEIYYNYLLNSDYLWSFFFWLDLVQVISMV